MMILGISLSVAFIAIIFDKDINLDIQNSVIRIFETALLGLLALKATWGRWPTNKTNDNVLEPTEEAIW